MSSVKISISQAEIRKFDKWLTTKNGQTVNRVKTAMKGARLEMESVAKLTVNEADLIDTGRMINSLQPTLIDGGYGVQLFVDLREVESPRVGAKSGAKAGIVAPVNYAAYWDKKIKFMEKSLEAARDKFLKLMSKKMR